MIESIKNIGTYIKTLVQDKAGSFVLGLMLSAPIIYFCIENAQTYKTRALHLEKEIEECNDEKFRIKEETEKEYLEKMKDIVEFTNSFKHNVNSEDTRMRKEIEYDREVIRGYENVRDDLEGIKDEIK